MSVKGEEAKERIIVSHGCSAEGEELIPFVIICHSTNPTCFKSFASHAYLPVSYSSNKIMPMTTELFQHWLDKLNSITKGVDDSIRLFVDNCTSHEDVQFSNAELVFLLPNTTLKLQP